MEGEGQGEKTTVLARVSGNVRTRFSRAGGVESEAISRTLSKASQCCFTHNHKWRLRGGLRGTCFLLGPF